MIATHPKAIEEFPTYITCPTQNSARASITHLDQDNRGTYIMVDATLFYPQGGGQPADLGEINFCDKNISVRVIDVRKTETGVRHYLEGLNSVDFDQITPGDAVVLHVDLVNRQRNSILHSAGHILAHMTEKLFKNIKATPHGQHFPDQAYIKFVMNDRSDLPENALEELNSYLSDFINNEQEVHEQRFDKQFRTIGFGQFEPVGCGGTHVNNINELNSIHATRVKVKALKPKEIQNDQKFACTIFYEAK